MKVQRLKVETEAQLQHVQDQIYQEASNGKRNFYGLLELVTNPVTIMTAIHRVKANKGHNTPGSDGKRMRDILKMDYDEVIQLVQQALLDYHPTPVRRVWIEKPGKKEKRPLGIPMVRSYCPPYRVLSGLHYQCGSDQPIHTHSTVPYFACADESLVVSNGAERACVARQ